MDKEVYGTDGVQMYNDFDDVKKGSGRQKLPACRSARLHYSDTWADASTQVIPSEWTSPTLSLLKDSIYNYTLRTLRSWICKFNA